MLNTISVQGRLTKDIEIKVTQSNINVCSFTLANDVGYGDKKKTNFINCVAWRGTCDLLSKYVTKGQMIIVSGQLDIRKWEKDSKTYYATEIVVEKVNFCGDKGQATQPQANDGFVPVDTGDDLPF